MKTTFITILLLIGIGHCSNLSACDINDIPKLTKEEMSKDAFRQKQKEYIISKAELTPKEAAYFFPLFFELQDKKKSLNDEIKRKMNEAKNQDLHEQEYESLINQITEKQINIEKLEKEYINKYRRVLSNKKIFKVMLAETGFRKEMLKSISNKKKSK